MISINTNDVDKDIKENVEKRYDILNYDERLNGIKVWVFFAKNIEKKHLCHHDKNYYYFCESNIPVINLIVDSRNMVKVSWNMNL